MALVIRGDRPGLPDQSARESGMYCCNPLQDTELGRENWPKLVSSALLSILLIFIFFFS